ncbi:hypothetical protein ACFOWZ_37260 [Lentzea rhizosphaerae]|uniref:Secreted protein n=1 Tax=Lentzea rhizosphaerae TaxID=2041025 RepID=A0ABV8C567_9PSEU
MICEPLCTLVGAFGGALRDVPAHTLASTVISALMVCRPESHRCSEQRGLPGCEHAGVIVSLLYKVLRVAVCSGGAASQ